MGSQTTAVSEYKVKYIIEGETYSTVYADYGQTVKRIEPESRDGFIFKGWYTSEEYIEIWDFDSDLIKNDTALYGYWVTEYEESFNVLFYDGFELIKYSKINKGEICQEFTPSSKDGYNFKGWYNAEKLYDFNAGVYGDLKLFAEWEPAVYMVTFIADGKITATRGFTIENKNISIPSVPQKQYYSGEWEQFEITLSDIEVNAIYTADIFTATFIVDGEVFKEIKYTVEDDVPVPKLPEKAGYTTPDWQGLPITGGDVTITADYTPIVYTVNFMAGKILIESIEYTVADKDITPPEVPERKGYAGVWEDFELTTGNITVYADYAIINYKATFIADGKIIGTEYFNIENMSVAEPALPEKEGYIVSWEIYTLNLEDITIKAIYTPVENA